MAWFTGLSVLLLALIMHVSCMPPRYDNTNENDLEESLLSGDEQCLFDPNSIGYAALKFIVANSLKPEDFAATVVLSSTTAALACASAVLIPFTYGITAIHTGSAVAMSMSLITDRVSRQRYLKQYQNEAAEMLTERFLLSKSQLDELRKIKMESAHPEGNDKALITLMQFFNKYGLDADAAMLRDFYFRYGGLQYRLVLTENNGHAISLEPLRKDE